MRIGLRAAVAALALLAVVAAGGPAQAAKRLTVSKTKGLARTGETVTVTGRGYDVSKGIYVAFCVDNGPGVLPSPCGGGADMSGASGSSTWISSNPPSYGEGLARPYGEGGSFRVSITVGQMIGDVDCTVRGCAIVTRADHTRTSDRSQDARVPVRFAPATSAAKTTAPATATPGQAGPAAKQSTPAGPPTGRLATAAPPSAGAAVALESQPTPLVRTSTATPLGHWWTIGWAFLAGLVAASVIGRFRRRKTERRKAAPDNGLAGEGHEDRPGRPSMSIRAAAVLAAALLLAGGCTSVSQIGPEPAASAGCGVTTAKLADDDVTPLDPRPIPNLPVTVTSADGRQVTVTSADRILAVNLYGSLGELVFSLGLGDRVIGRDTSTTFPAAAKLPLVTPQGHDLSAEAILKLNPTVLLADDSIGPPTVLEQVRAAGIPVVIVDDEQTLAAVPLHIKAVAAALGVPEAGERLVTRVRSEIDTAQQAAPRDGKPIRIAFLYVRGTAGVFLIGGKGAGSDAMIEAIGAVDAGSAAGLTKFRPLTSEGLINTAPDVILVMTEGLNSVGGVDGLLKLPGVAQTPAGANRRVVDMDDGILLNFGGRTGKAVAALAKAVYGPCD